VHNSRSLPFRPLIFCEDDLWSKLQPANQIISRLVRELTLQDQSLHLRLRTPGIMEETWAEPESRATVDAILKETKGQLTSLFISAQLPWILPYLQQNNKLCGLFYINTASVVPNDASYEPAL
jgi:hypothetical protein